MTAEKLIYLWLQRAMLAAARLAEWENSPDQKWRIRHWNTVSPGVIISAETMREDLAALRAMRDSFTPMEKKLLTWTKHVEKGFGDSAHLAEDVRTKLIGLALNGQAAPYTVTVEIPTRENGRVDALIKQYTEAGYSNVRWGSLGYYAFAYADEPMRGLRLTLT